MARIKTYCFKYKNIDYDIVYTWIEAVSKEAAKRIFSDDVETQDCLKIIDIYETFTWQ